MITAVFPVPKFLGLPTYLPYKQRVPMCGSILVIHVIMIYRVSQKNHAPFHTALVYFYPFANLNEKSSKDLKKSMVW